MKVLILIDPLQIFCSELDIAIKSNIAMFLRKISNTTEWRIIHWGATNQFDCDIRNILRKSNNSIIESDARKVYRSTTNTTFYFAGLHSNHCIFDKLIGIDKLLELVPNQKFHIIDELSCCVTINGESVLNTQLPVTTQLIQSYRNLIIKNNLISLDQILIEYGAGKRN